MLFTRPSVSIHAPVWGATIRYRSLYLYSKFQSTHPCGVRRELWLNANKLIGFQSTHPCGVRPYISCAFLVIRVSIHAPVWGATLQIVTSGKFVMVSIHAPVWGATILAKFGISFWGFQSTHPCGVRQMRYNVIFSKLCFNPRTRVGCDRFSRYCT